MTEDYNEIVGQQPGDAYDVDGAIGRDCTNCGAPAGVRCTVEASGRLIGRRHRRMPCIARFLRPRPVTQPDPHLQAAIDKGRELANSGKYPAPINPWSSR